MYRPADFRAEVDRKIALKRKVERSEAERAAEEVEARRPPRDIFGKQTVVLAMRDAERQKSEQPPKPASTPETGGETQVRRRILANDIRRFHQAVHEFNVAPYSFVVDKANTRGRSYKAYEARKTGKNPALSHKHPSGYEFSGWPIGNFVIGRVEGGKPRYRALILLENGLIAATQPSKKKQDFSFTTTRRHPLAREERQPVVLSTIDMRDFPISPDQLEQPGSLDSQGGMVHGDISAFDLEAAHIMMTEAIEAGAEG